MPCGVARSFPRPQPQEPPSEIPREEQREARSAKRTASEQQRAALCAHVFQAPALDGAEYARLMDQQRQEKPISLEENFSLARFRLCDILAVQPRDLTVQDVEDWMGHERRVFLFDHCIEFYRDGPRLWARDHEGLVRELTGEDGVAITQQIDYGMAADLREKPIEGLCRLLEGLQIRLEHVAFGGIRFGPGGGPDGPVGWSEDEMLATARSTLLPTEDKYAASLEVFRQDGYSALASVTVPIPGRAQNRRAYLNANRTVRWLRGTLGAIGLKVHSSKEGIRGEDDGGPGGRSVLVTWDSHAICTVFERREGSRDSRLIDMQ